MNPLLHTRVDFIYKPPIDWPETKILLVFENNELGDVPGYTVSYKVKIFKSFATEIIVILFFLKPTFLEKSVRKTPNNDIN
jgi:hypothetical protein